VDFINIKDISAIMAYVSDRNTQCAVDLNNKLMARIKELMGDGPDFPPIAVMLTNDQSIMIGHDPNKLVYEGIVFFYIVDLGPGNQATGVNTFWTVDLNLGVIVDNTDGITVLQ
jgi:hypothetical protein